MTPEQLVGAWRLRRFQTVGPGGVRFPLGDDALGQIIYSASGHMSAVLSRASRELRGSDRLEDAHRASVIARAEAFDSYLSYGGQWWLEGDEVVHAVEFSLVPAAVGKKQRRTLSFTGKELLLSYVITGRRGPVRFELSWERSSPRSPPP